MNLSASRLAGILFDHVFSGPYHRVGEDGDASLVGFASRNPFIGRSKVCFTMWPTSDRRLEHYALGLQASNVHTREGAGTIPAKELLELVRLLPEGESTRETRV